MASFICSGNLLHFFTVGESGSLVRFTKTFSPSSPWSCSAIELSANVDLKSSYVVAPSGLPRTLSSTKTYLIAGSVSNGKPQLYLLEISTGNAKVVNLTDKFPVLKLPQDTTFHILFYGGECFHWVHWSVGEEPAQLEINKIAAPSKLPPLGESPLNALVTPHGSHVIFKDKNGEVHDMEHGSTLGEWKYLNIFADSFHNKKSFSAAKPAKSDPSAVLRDGKTIHVYYRGTDNRLRELIKRTSKPWKHVSLRHYVSDVEDIRGNVCASFLTEIHAFYLNKNRQLMEILWKGLPYNRWYGFNLSSIAHIKFKIGSIISNSVDGQSMHMFVTDRETDETYHITWDKVWMAENLSTIAMHKTSLRGSGLIKPIDDDGVKIDEFAEDPTIIQPPPPPPPPATSKRIVVPTPSQPKPHVVVLPWRAKTPPSTTEVQKIRLVILSDTHNYVDRIPIPEGDILVHAGDFTVYGQQAELLQFRDWLQALPIKYRVIINGNHEVNPDLSRKMLKDDCYFLEDSFASVLGINFFGTKWKADYDKIPANTDILITHKPPTGHGDIIYTGESRGSDSLAAKVSQLQIPLHIFGHNHEGYGAESDDTTTYINAATCVGGAKSAARRQAIVVDYYPSLKQFYHV